MKEVYRSEVIVFDKNWKIFIFKNNFRPIDFLLARLFFRKKKQSVVSRKFVIYPKILSVDLDFKAVSAEEINEQLKTLDN